MTHFHFSPVCLVYLPINAPAGPGVIDMQGDMLADCIRSCNKGQEVSINLYLLDKDLCPMIRTMLDQ